MDFISDVYVNLYKIKKLISNIFSRYIKFIINELYIIFLLLSFNLRSLFIFYRYKSREKSWIVLKPLESLITPIPCKIALIT